MLRRSWLPLCLWLVLGTSVVSLVAAPSRHRNDSPVHKRIKHIVHFLGASQDSPPTQVGVGGPGTGALSGGTASTSSTLSQHSKQSGWSLRGIKEWWDKKLKKLKRSLARKAPSDPTQNGEDPPASGGTGISLASGGTRGTTGSTGGGSKKHRSDHGASGGGSGSVSTPVASGSGGGSGATPGGSGSGTGAGGSGSGSGDPSSPAGGTGPVSGNTGGTSAGSGSTTGGNPSGSGGGSSSGTGGGSAGAPPPSGETRDPAYWPFAANSPWNYPIGSNAQYADFGQPGARRPAAGTGIKLGADNNTSVIWIAQPTDPMRTLTYNQMVYQMQVPDAAGVNGGEGFMTVMDPSHIYAQDLYSASRRGDGNWRASGALINVLLKGSGWGDDPTVCLGPNLPPDTSWCRGQTRASGMSIFAGAIRPGELTNGIRHALALLVGGALLRQSPGHVWPAIADDGASTYSGGPNSNYSLGQLVAIPWTVDVERLPLALPQSRIIARALQRYGAYSVDTSFGLFDIVVDGRATSEFRPWLNDPNWANDMYEVIGAQLRVVTNSFDPTSGGPPRNGVKLDGGDGTVGVPLAPPFDR